MENEGFLGIYGIRDKDLSTAMPARNKSGLWQAWFVEGGYMVQALDHDRRPQGNSYLIDEVDFHTLLSPVSPADEESAGNNARPLRSDAPDLLNLWFEQAIVEENARIEGIGTGSAPDESVAALAEEDADPALGFSRAHAKLSTEESLFGPVWHPDEIWADASQGENPVYSVANFIEPGAHAQGGDTPASMEMEAAGLPEAGHGAGSDTIMAQDAGAGRKALLESEALALEKSMRQKFNELFDELDDNDQPALERELALLLDRGFGFTWKQKFMFSEFGLALRRKHKYTLALAAHKRALGLAQDDENILFNVARAEYELGNFENARQLLEKALDIAPDFASALTFLRFLDGSLDK